jgi:hypothetical protein
MLLRIEPPLRRFFGRPEGGPRPAQQEERLVY